LLPDQQGVPREKQRPGSLITPGLRPNDQQAPGELVRGRVAATAAVITRYSSGRSLGF
jgi:hypothetical protein